MKIRPRLDDGSMILGAWCVVCGEYGYPPTVAFFTPADEWVCDRCIDGGEEGIRQTFRERAEQHRLAAEAVEQAASQEISLPTQAEIEAVQRRAELGEAVDP
jgi:hypothetical protein